MPIVGSWGALFHAMTYRSRLVGAPSCCSCSTGNEEGKETQENYTRFLLLEVMKANILLARGNQSQYLIQVQGGRDPTRHFVHLAITATLTLIKPLSIPRFKEHHVQLYHYINRGCPQLWDPWFHELTSMMSVRTFLGRRLHLIALEVPHLYPGPPITAFCGAPLSL